MSTAAANPGWLAVVLQWWCHHHHYCPASEDCCHSSCVACCCLLFGCLLLVVPSVSVDSVTTEQLWLLLSILATNGGASNEKLFVACCWLLSLPPVALFVLWPHYKKGHLHCYYYCFLPMFYQHQQFLVILFTYFSLCQSLAEGVDGGWSLGHAQQQLLQVPPAAWCHY